MFRNNELITKRGIILCVRVLSIFFLDFDSREYKIANQKTEKSKTCCVMCRSRRNSNQHSSNHFVAYLSSVSDAKEFFETTS